MRANTEEERDRELLKYALTDGYWQRTGYRTSWEHLGPLMDAILESQWLAKHDAQVRREALKEARDAVQYWALGDARLEILKVIDGVSSVEGDAKLSGNSVVGEETK